MTAPAFARRTAPKEDIEQILHLHREWWESNLDWDIPRMSKVFPEPGDEYLMFNFNGHPYFNMREKTALWEFYRDIVDQSGGMTTKVMRLEVKGDMAWLACEFSIEAEMVDGGEWTADNVDATVGRATEIYHRDNGAGALEWRMWHTQITALPPLDEERPGLGGSTASRGLGWVPWNPLPEGV
ncbi:nuclear transport factor 2 family protein [Nocardioides sp. LHD-245]|uniref:YybH family protein n=1 Tax=Nocardioides sp. LHD-245 TaxID=3051387 RepID=UPI0027E07C1C|nr:nuclear transport factor 2 family protein [Nocardioides sp. LHD-245]